MYNYDLITMNKLIASDTSNYYTPNEAQVGTGIGLNSDLVSIAANSLWYKTSAAIQYIQENGGILWIPEKKYKVGSIVWVNCVVAGSNTLIPLKCIKNSPSQTYCKELPITDQLVKEESGYWYFNGNTINKEYWVSVLIDTNVTNSISITPHGSATGTANNDIKFIKLIDFNQNDDLIEGDFVIKIERESKFIMATIHIHAYKNKAIEIIVKDVLSDAYSGIPGANNTIWISGSPFKDLALLGCILSLDDDKCLYLNILNSQGGSIVNINTELEGGNLPLTLTELTKSKTWYDDVTNVIVPFINGASNSFTGCGHILTYFGKPNYEYVFRNGLLRVIENQSPSQFLYPSIQKVTQSTTLPDITNRYLLDDNKGAKIEPELPNIKAEWALFDDDAWGNRSSVFQSMYNISAWYPSDNKGAFYIKRESTEEAKIQYRTNPNYTTGINTNRAGYPVQNHLGNIAGIDASKMTPVYKDGGTVKVASQGVFVYQKCF